MSLRIVFMGTPEFAVPSLRALVAAKHDVVGVFTQPDRPVGRGQGMRHTPVKEEALKLGLRVHQPLKLSEPDAMATLTALAPDLIVVVAFGQILRDAVLNLPRLGCINVHSSILPRWRGAAPIQWALLSGDAETGVTIQKMVKELDAGDVISSRVILIGKDETAGSLHDRLMIEAASLLPETVQELEYGIKAGVPQDPTRVTYASKLTKDMERLDPALSALELERRVRALTPWPGTSITLEDDGGRLRVHEVRAQPVLSGTVGTLEERHGMLVLPTSEGCLELLKVQMEGKKPISASEYLNGLKGRGKSLPLRLKS